MKKLITQSLFILSLIVLLFSCEKKGEPAEIKEMKVYDDPVTKFSIKYPSNWFTQSSPGQRFVCYTAQTARERFAQYEGKGLACAKFEVLIQKLTDGKTMDSVIQSTKLFTQDKYSAPTKVKIDGIDATKLTYNFELEDGMFNGEVYYAQKDPQYVAVIFFEAFSGTLEAYRKSIDEVLASVKLPVTPQAKDTIFKQEEADPPSKTMTSKGGDGYSIEIPDNFRAEGSKAAGTLSSRNYIGNRRADCNIQIDVIDASKQKNLKKIVEENSPKYKNSKPQEIKIGGVQAYVMPYSFKKDVESKVYFVIKGEKLYRITMNWYKPEEADYLPIFEKSIKSIKFN